MPQHQRLLLYVEVGPCCAGAAAPRFPDKPSEYQSQAEFVKWAKNTMCEMDRESLMGDMPVARMQQEFARAPPRVPLVHNKVGLRLAPLLSSGCFGPCSTPTSHHTKFSDE